MEALQSRKAEKPIGQAGNGDRRPERKGVASKSRDLRNDRRPKSQSLGLPDSQRSEAPRGAYEGTKAFAVTNFYRDFKRIHGISPMQMRLRNMNVELLAEKSPSVDACA